MSRVASRQHTIENPVTHLDAANDIFWATNAQRILESGHQVRRISQDVFGQPAIDVERPTAKPIAIKPDRQQPIGTLLA